MTNEFINGLLWGGGGVLLTIIGLWVFIFKTEYGEALLDRRSKKESKRKLADDVIRICTEAMSSGFEKKPREYEDVYFVMNKLKIYDKTLAKTMEQAVSRWVLFSNRNDVVNPKEMNAEGTKFFNAIRKTAQEKCEKLLETVGKWK